MSKQARLIMRKWISDADGKHVGYEYLTEIIELKSVDTPLGFEPEIVGGEYINDFYDSNVSKRT